MQKLLKKINNYIKNNKALVFSLAFATLYTTFTFAAPYSPSDAVLNPTCAPGDAGCYVNPLSIGATVYSGTAGSILFAGTSGALTQDNTNLYFNNSTDVLTIGGDALIHTLTVGQGAGSINTNVAFGLSALAANTTGYKNVAVGNAAMQQNTTGLYDTAVGQNALNANTTGYYNTAIGKNVMFTNTIGYQNTAIGVETLRSNIAGSNNLALGVYAGYNTGATGNYENNILLGFSAGNNITTGASNNIVLGYDIDLPTAGGSNQLTIGNLIFGTGIDGTSTTISTGKIGIGVAAPTAALHLKAGTATANTAPLKLTAGTNLGTTEAGAIEYDGTHLYFTAVNAGTRYQLDQQGSSSYTFSTGLTNSASTITNNLSTGVSGGQSVVGGTAASNNLTLSSTSHATKGKIIFGTSAYDEVNNRLGIGTATPTYALDVASDALVNTVRIGMGAGSTTNSTAVGYQVLNSNTTGGANSAFGYQAMRSNTSGLSNSAFGYQTLYSNEGSTSNSAFGQQALYSNTTGVANSAFGLGALYSNTTGSSNIAMGYAAGYNTGVNGAYSNNIFIGYQAANNITTGADSNIVIGYDVDLPTAGGSNQMTIGNIIFGTGITGTGTTIAGAIGIGTNAPAYRLDVQTDAADFVANFFNDGNATTRKGILVQAGEDTVSTTTNVYMEFRDGDGGVMGAIDSGGGSNALRYNSVSDRRLKQNINDSSFTIGDLMNIKVHDYTWIADPLNTINHGFIAQELYEILPEAVSKPNDESTGTWMVDYSKLTPLLVKSVQDINLKLVSMENFDTDTSFVGNLRNWLASAANGIQKIFTKEVETENLCVSNGNGEKTCITKSQLDNLLLNSGQNSNSDSTNSQQESSTSNESVNSPVEENTTDTNSSETIVQTDTENTQNTDTNINQTPSIIEDQSATISQ